MSTVKLPYQYTFEPDYIQINEKMSQLTQLAGKNPSGQPSELIDQIMERIKMDVSENDLEFRPSSIYSTYASANDLKSNKAAEMCPNCGDEIKKVAQCEFCTEIYCKSCCWRKRVIPGLSEKKQFKLCCEQCHEKFVKLMVNQKFYAEKAVLTKVIQFAKAKFEKSQQKAKSVLEQSEKFNKSKTSIKIKENMLQKTLQKEQKKLKEVKDAFEQVIREKAQKMRQQQERLAQQARAKELQELQKRRKQEQERIEREAEAIRQAQRKQEQENEQRRKRQQEYLAEKERKRKQAEQINRKKSEEQQQIQAVLDEERKKQQEKKAEAERIKKAEQQKKLLIQREKEKVRLQEQQKKKQAELLSKQQQEKKRKQSGSSNKSDRKASPKIENTPEQQPMLVVPPVLTSDILPVKIQTETKQQVPAFLLENKANIQTDQHPPVIKKALSQREKTNDTEIGNNQTEGTDKNEPESLYQSVPLPEIKVSEMTVNQLLSMHINPNENSSRRQSRKFQLKQPMPEEIRTSTKTEDAIYTPEESEIEQAKRQILRTSLLTSATPSHRPHQDDDEYTQPEPQKCACSLM